MTKLRHMNVVHALLGGGSLCWLSPRHAMRRTTPGSGRSPWAPVTVAITTDPQPPSPGGQFQQELHALIEGMLEAE